MDHVFNELIDLSKQFWQVSFFATILFSVFTLFAAKFAVGVLNGANASSPTHDAIINSIGWVFYLVPIVFGVVTLFFWCKHNQRICGVKIHLTNALRRIRNARRFWFNLAFVFTVQ
ncbi:hypothetical protein CGI60_23870 [Vibrio parahaemolyticus]|nr:hypothetical protein CGI60_23870 [Vibrio parahaemolyticus]